MTGLARHVLWIANLTALVILWTVLRPDLRQDWPVLLTGFLLGAFPFAVAAAWKTYRGRRIGRF